MVGFIIGHTAGNALMYIGIADPSAGQDAINTYAYALKSNAPLLWGTRIALLISVILHVYYTLKLAGMNSSANPVKYKVKKKTTSTFGSSNATWLGLMILFFVIYHLAHYTFLVTHNEYATMMDPQGRHDVYSMVLAGFSKPIISIFYVLGVVSLGFHLKHGVQSMVHTLGFHGPNIKEKANKASNLIAFFVTVFLGFIPLAVLLGLVGEVK
jgi:succinate dehydrogenase / fumarate reductase cytochrome b subunit